MTEIVAIGVVYQDDTRIHLDVTRRTSEGKETNREKWTVEEFENFMQFWNESSQTEHGEVARSVRSDYSNFSEEFGSQEHSCVMDAILGRGNY